MRWPLLLLAAALALALLGLFLAPAAEAQTTPGHYDTDGDTLIEISNLAQLNAVRWDLNGDGTPSSGNATNYNAAFPVTSGGSVCPSGTTCTGYELLANLDFDENGDGEITEAGDPTYWNTGSGWEPIGKDTPVEDSVRYNAVFEGNRHTVSNLFINRGSTDDVGLFGSIGTAGVVRTLGVVDASVTAQQYVGSLAGSSYGSILRSYAGGANASVSGSKYIGGLAGFNGDTISASYAAVAVSSTAVGSSDEPTAGGLVGLNTSNIIASYATGVVSANGRGASAGGLVGNNRSTNNEPSMIIASYATGAVSATGAAGHSIAAAGGLVGINGSNSGIIASYATGPARATGATDSGSGGLVGYFNGGSLTNSYFGTDTSGLTDAVGAVPDGNTAPDGASGETTAQLQAPTGYAGIYANWRNIDLDGDANTNDFWDFGTASQYPALKADLNDDGTSSWQEFGYQLREAPVASISTYSTPVTISWSAVDNTHWTPNPARTYQVYKGSATLGDPVTGTSAVDDGFSDVDDLDTQYRVVALLGGFPARTSAAATTLSAPVLSVTSPSVNEGDSGTTTMTFTLTLSEAREHEVHVGATIISEGTTATADDDFVDRSDLETLTFMAGETSKTYAVTVNGDTTVEEDETVVVGFGGPLTNAVFDSALNPRTVPGIGELADVAGTILNDDIAPTAIALSVSPTNVGEGAGSTPVGVRASFPPDSGTLESATDVEVTVGAGSGSATEGTDYANVGQVPLRIRSGSRSATATFTLTPIDDTASEGDESISITGTATGFTVNSATLTIVDDEISASISSPSSLNERGLDGARLTVDLVATQYVSSLTPGDFGILPRGVRGLSVASVSRVSDTRAVLTLGFSGDIDSDVDLQIVVDASAHTSSGSLTTAGVAVTQAPTPGRVTGVTATGGPGSLIVFWPAVANADGYVVEWKQSDASAYADGDRIAVSGGSTTQATIGGLLGVTAYDARVYAVSDFANNGPVSAHATATTLPSHAVVSSTDPSPLSETNLDGATVTVDLLIYDRWARQPMTAEQVTASGVPGVRASGVTRVSDKRAVVTLAYDGRDFDSDATLRLDFYRAHTSIETIIAVTDVRAVDERPPGQVENVRLTPGPQRIEVRWNAVPDADGYVVEWRRTTVSPVIDTPEQTPTPQEDECYPADRQYELRNRPQPFTIGGLTPGCEYGVKVIATRHKAPDGPPSAEARATTPAFSYRISATAPAQLTGANLYGATLNIQLQGAEWELAVAGRQHRVRLSGLDTGVWVERVEHISPSELRVVLGHRGPAITEDAISSS